MLKFKNNTVLSRIHSLLVEEGKCFSVSMDESTYIKFVTFLRVIHFDWYYKRNNSGVTSDVLVTYDMLKHGKLSKELSELEYKSYNDLNTNKSYGSIINNF